MDASTTPTAWAEPTTATLADVAPGDFLVEIPTQGRIRGLDVRSTVTHVDPSFRWEEYVPSPVRGRRGYRHNVPGVKLAVATPAGGTIDLPASFTCTVRKAVA